MKRTVNDDRTISAYEFSDPECFEEWRLTLSDVSLTEFHPTNNTESFQRIDLILPKVILTLVVK